MKLRRALAVVLCLLLLSLQSQALVHPIAHLAGQAKSQDTEFTSSKVDVPCVECALLSGGSMTVVAHVPSWHGSDSSYVVVFHSYRSRAADAPAWFQSRAPPHLV